MPKRLPGFRYFVVGDFDWLGKSHSKCWVRTKMKSDRGTIAPLIATYLALILLSVFGSVAVVTALVAVNRVQGIADMAILYAHDRSVTAGIPNQAQLSHEIALFLQKAPSAQRLVILSTAVRVKAETSTLRMCARYQNPLGIGVDSAIICRESKAKSFLVP